LREHVERVLDMWFTDAGHLLRASETSGFHFVLGRYDSENKNPERRFPPGSDGDQFCRKYPAIFGPLGRDLWYPHGPVENCN
jgi:hypothetical protein